jgi:hypothetical protein
MRTAVALSRPTYIALPAEPATDEVAHQIGRDASSAARAGQQRVLRARTRRQLPSASSSNLGLFEQLVELVGEVLVDQLQLGDAVLVVERDGRAVFDGVAEVVDADVLAELLDGSPAPRPRSAECR